VSYGNYNNKPFYKSRDSSSPEKTGVAKDKQEAPVKKIVRCPTLLWCYKTETRSVGIAKKMAK